MHSMKLVMPENVITNVLPLSQDALRMLNRRGLLDPRKLYFYTKNEVLDEMFKEKTLLTADKQNIAAGCALARYSAKIYCKINQ